MRYELTDHEWAAIKPMLPNKPRCPAGERRRVLNGIFWVLRSGAPINHHMYFAGETARDRCTRRVDERVQ